VRRWCSCCAATISWAACSRHGVTFGGAPWTTLGRLTMGIVAALVHLLEHLFRLRHGLGGSPLFDGQGRCDRCAQLMLHMEEVRRVMRPEVLYHIRQQARRLIAGRLYSLTVETCQGRRHPRLSGIVIPCLSCLLQ